MGLDDDHSICIWDWKKEEKLASTRGHKDMIFVIEWNPFNINYLVSVGEKHIDQGIFIFGIFRFFAFELVLFRGRH